MATTLKQFTFYNVITLHDGHHIKTIYNVITLHDGHHIKTVYNVMTLHDGHHIKTIYNVITLHDGHHIKTVHILQCHYITCTSIKCKEKFSLSDSLPRNEDRGKRAECECKTCKEPTLAQLVSQNAPYRSVEWQGKKRSRLPSRVGIDLIKLI